MCPFRRGAPCGGVAAEQRPAADPRRALWRRGQVAAAIVHTVPRRPTGPAHRRTTPGTAGFPAAPFVSPYDTLS